MKAYIQAEMQIVHTNNSDIVTTSVRVGNPYTSDSHTADAPGRRRSIWD